MGRHLGQHFLYQRPILERIAQAACAVHSPLVVEIGPGPGALTECLRSRCDRLFAIELDPVLALELRARWHEDPAVSILESDVLSTDLAQWGPAVVCGNLPYYITSPIIEKTLQLGPGLIRAAFLVQREVADRLAARPGSRDFGYLSAATQVQCAVKRLFVLKPSAFRPPPKVDSAVITLTPLAVPIDPDLDAFRRFAALCFRQKRKTLRNNLVAAVPRDLLDSLPESSLRAEQLSVADLANLRLRLKDAGVLL